MLFFKIKFNIIVMKAKVLTFIVLVSFFVVLVSAYNVNAQDCKYFYPTKKGSELEYTSYDKKGKVESVQTHKIVENKKVGKATVVVVEQTIKSQDKKEKDIKTNFEVKCDDGKFYLNMDDFTKGINLDQYKQNPDMDVVVKSDELFIPSDIAVGTKMPDGEVNIDVVVSGIPMFTTNVLVKNRKVELQETITTPAGSFDCLKITSDVITKSMMTIESKTIQWIAEGVGVVKTETYAKDKLASSQMLTKITK